MKNRQDRPKKPAGKKAAFQFIALLGVVSLFGDITYEGARSITGPYLAFLGAGAGVVGFVGGLGESIGYALRLASGYFADRTRAYWTLTFIGYGLILSIPMLAFAGHWHAAALLIILERAGKAVRTPARDAILSHATKKVGRGLGFGIHEALDQVGAVLGPLIFTGVFFFGGNYREGFSILWIPGILTLAFLFLARLRVKAPAELEAPPREELEAPAGEEPAHAEEIRAARGGKLPRAFWLYTLFSFFSVAGFANFQLISFHFKTQSVISDIQIPIFYIVAMAVDAVVAPIIGKTYDKAGLATVVAIPLLSIPIPFLAFSLSPGLALASVILWGAVMGIHETVMRAAIADLSPIERRGFAYGIFNAAYGVSWLLGGVVMGQLYDISLQYIMAFVVLAEALSLAVFLYLKKSL
jgi:MFS family permease